MELLSLVFLIGLSSISARPAIVNPSTYLDHAADYDTHPKYAFKYGVSDPQTGDHKSQHEQRDGDVVKGQYSLVEPDGSVRTVDYTADPVHGFHAVVSKSAPSIHAVADQLSSVLSKPVESIAAAHHVLPITPIVNQVAPAIVSTPLVHAQSIVKGPDPLYSAGFGLHHGYYDGYSTTYLGHPHGYDYDLDGYYDNQYDTQY